MRPEELKVHLDRHKAAGRKVCSPASPMPKDATGRWVHINAHEIGTRFNGDVAVYECDDCGHSWEAELPQ